MVGLAVGGGQQFLCTCAACTILPDRCRAFRCPSKDCHNGKVCPQGDGGDGSSERSSKDWGCLDCGYQCGAEEIEALVAAEESLVQALESADNLGEMMNDSSQWWCTIT